MKKSIIRLDKKKVEIILLILIIIILALIVGLNRINTSDFRPNNGDWQNYNPIRRLLDGQIPYKDFSVYLGSGHLILLTFFQLIIGNNFTNSLLITNMTTVLIFELTVFIVSLLVLQNKRKALYITLGITLINIIRPQFLTNINEEFIEALDFGLAPGTSARLIRIAIAPILVTLIYIGYRFFDNSKRKIVLNNKNLVKKIYLSIIAGMGIVWSNDGGIASYITISFIYFLLLVKEYKKDVKSIIKYVIMYIAISLTSTLMLIAIITRGNIFSWLKFTLGVSEYQKWYYGAAYAKENLSLLSLDKTIFNVIMILIAIYYVYKLLKSINEKQILRYAMLSFMVISSIVSTYLYQILSGGTSKSMLILILLLLICDYLVIIFENMCKENKVNALIKKGTVILAIGVILSNVAYKLTNIKYKDENAVYIEELGGRLTKYGNSIEYASNRIGDEKIFSTYASAIEAVTDQFQPTEMDYIIHCLGDEQRREYLDIFKNGNFKYVTTIEGDNGYRYWMRSSNWFFYKELYKDYKPSFATEYNVFYEKNRDNEDSTNGEHNIQTEITRLTDSEYSIKLKTEDKNFNGIVDVELMYNSEYKRSFFRTLDISKYVCIEDTTVNEIAGMKIGDYNIPDEKGVWNIPITLVEGEGEIKISSYPINNTILNIDNLEVLDSYDVMFKYCHATMNKIIDGNTLYIDKTNENKVIMKDVKSIKIGDISRNIIKYYEDESYIILELDGTAKDFEYPNYFEVIK